MKHRAVSVTSKEQAELDCFDMSIILKDGTLR